MSYKSELMKLVCLIAGCFLLLGSASYSARQGATPDSSKESPLSNNIKIVLDGQVLANKSSVHNNVKITKNMVTIQLGKLNSDLVTLLAIRAPVGDLANTPLTLPYAGTVKAGPTFMVTSTMINKKQYAAVSGTAVLEEFSREKIVLKMNCKGGGHNANTYSGTDLVDIDIEVVINNPNMQFLGVEPSEVK